MFLIVCWSMVDIYDTKEPKKLKRIKLNDLLQLSTHDSTIRHKLNLYNSILYKNTVLLVAAAATETIFRQY